MSRHYEIFISISDILITLNNMDDNAYDIHNRMIYEISPRQSSQNNPVIIRKHSHKTDKFSNVYIYI